MQAHMDIEWIAGQYSGESTTTNMVARVVVNVAGLSVEA
jgi:hypothetical protein